MKLVPPGTSRLQRFQEHFARALFDASPPDDCGAGVARLLAQPGFAVYRNTVHGGCIDALVANYPAITRLVGEEWMRGAAAAFMHTHRPATPMLLDYGQQFPDFLAGFPPAAELPYLCDVARLDRFWTEAHKARDEAPLDGERLAALAAEDCARTRLRPHASARWAWFDDQPIYTIWSRNRAAENFDGSEIAWTGEGALVVRPFAGVQTSLLDRAEAAFLDACAARQTLAEAAAAAFAANASVDLAQSLTRLLAAGAFGAMETDRTDVTQPGEPS